VTNLVRELVDEGVIGSEDRVHQGRKAKWISPRAGAECVLGIDVGRSHVRIALVDLGFNVLGELQQRLARNTPSADILALVGEMLEELLATTGVERASIVRAGAGIPGPIDQKRHRIGTPSLLPEWAGIDLPAAFEAATGVPTSVDNDSNLGALGEYAWPPALDVDSLFRVRLTTGIGGGLVINGKPWRGVDGTAAEIGHHSIDESGALCRCGNRGCVEAIASVPGFLEVLGRAVGHEVDPDEWVQLAQQGNTTAGRLLEDLGRHVGVAVANIVNLVNPSRILIGGPISAVGDILLAPLRAEVRQRAVPAATRGIRIELGRWGDLAEVYGAAIMAMQAQDSVTYSIPKW
jgi:predicted NBD/HSP70 family sugar kinase